jgi:uncharacterized protein (DUF302 family)
MDRANIYIAETGKSVAKFASDFTSVVQKYGFIVNNVDTMNMAENFVSHGAEVGDGFDLHMIQVCKPAKAAPSLSGNPERSVLMPKFVMAFSKNGKTQIRYLSYSEADIRAVVDDDVFPGALAESFAKIRSMIDEAV